MPKIKHKMSEFSQLMKAFRKEWLDILKQETLKKSKVKTNYVLSINND